MDKKNGEKGLENKNVLNMIEEFCQENVVKKCVLNNQKSYDNNDQ